MLVLVVLRIFGKPDVCFPNRRDGVIAAVWMGQDAVCVLDSLLNYFSERAFARGTGAVFDEMAVGLQVLV